MKHLYSFGLAVVSALLLVTAINFALPYKLANTLTGYDGNPANFVNWINIHVWIWIAFFMGMVSVWQVAQGLRAQKLWASEDILDRDPLAIYDRNDRIAIYSKVGELPPEAIVRQMIQRPLAQYQGSKSWSQANEVLQSTTLEVQNRTELSYTLSRYLSWLIPTLGFIGTVLGISEALGQIGVLTPADFAEATFLPAVISSLGIAFSTTLIALVLSGILILYISIIQAEEEAFITDIFGDCVENLLNKLHED